MASNPIALAGAMVGLCGIVPPGDEFREPAQNRLAGVILYVAYIVYSMVRRNE